MCGEVDLHRTRGGLGSSESAAQLSCKREVWRGLQSADGLQLQHLSQMCCP